MEVRINKEVRNYQESLFFGLSLRQFLFALLAVAVAVGVSPRAGAWRDRLGLHSGRVPICLGRFFPVQRHESGTIFIGVFSLRISHPKTACVQIGKYICKTDGTHIDEGGAKT